MIAHDTHTHSSYSTDGGTTVRALLERARDIGLRGICLTDHMDYEFPAGLTDIALPKGEFPFVFDIGKYVDELQSLRHSGEFSPLDILIGVECGLQALPSILEKNKGLVSNPALDYVIGSLHLTGGRDPYYPEFWEGRSPEECVRQYLVDLYENIRAFPYFDSLGHLDYIVRYAPPGFHYDPWDYQEILDEILRILVRKDIALELNTSGCQSTPYPNPHPAILGRYLELGGGMVTAGSDAHAPEFLAYRFDRLAQVMRDAGLRQYVTFHRRKPRFWDL